ncbi:glycosyltransferase family 4 protein [Chelativorans alearense]|uniref:glycosyltransferase family 4 protein n=1 Tax=Chelativorans alearense TaxID=2681495 RepID=UPI0013D87A46|nr:glycosyltransferase family 4 protein [Chelativorans alearense]
MSSSLTWVALRPAHRHGVPFVVEVRDLWPQALIDSRRRVLQRLFCALEKHLYRAAEKILVAWPKAESYIKALGIEGDKVVWLSKG